MKIYPNTYYLKNVQYDISVMFDLAKITCLFQPAVKWLECGWYSCGMWFVEVWTVQERMVQMLMVDV